MHTYTHTYRCIYVRTSDIYRYILTAAFHVCVRERESVCVCVRVCVCVCACACACVYVYTSILLKNIKQNKVLCGKLLTTAALLWRV